MTGPDVAIACDLGGLLEGLLILGLVFIPMLATLIIIIALIAYLFIKV